MSRQKGTPRHDRASIKYKSSRVKGAIFEHTGFVNKEYGSGVPDNNKGSKVKSELKSPYILSTKDLVSAVGQIWDIVNHVDVSVSKAKLKNNGNDSSKSVSLDNLLEEDVGSATLDSDYKYFHVDSINIKNSNYTPKMQQKFEFLKVTQKLALFEAHMHPLLWHSSKGNTKLLMSSLKGRGLARLEKTYEWMSDIIPARAQYSKTKSKELSQSSMSGSLIGTAGSCNFVNITHSLGSSSVRSADCYFDLVNSKDESLCADTEIAANASVTSCLGSSCLKTNVNNCTSRSTCSSFHVDQHLENLSSDTVSNCNNDQNEVPESARKQNKLITGVANENGMHSPAHKKSQYLVAKQEHAFAGAFAGIFVSICLHPIDTVKTVIQSCRVEQKSICNIGRSIISEKGVMGLYRGIASNIASSAPISGIYTFTYESVKGSLLPSFPKEYHSFVHCIAGGCSSLATSFIFTPSERIKQQMQVGFRYHNCWNALVEIVSKGGLPSLYTGWTAVLCRNIPHSIIKFYTYECLKQSVVLSRISRDPPYTVQTLVCGGLAGSTAALFTTPFDVVKTRLQTQIPGSMSQYHSVFHTLKQIGKTEGLKGLYRGLIPRLLMYMSQGALFFASYEFLKRLLSLEFAQLKAQGNYCKELEDDTTALNVP